MMKPNKLIDHTLLKPQSVKEQIETLCEEAKTYDFASVCVNPYWVSTCAALLKGSDVKVCTVIGFPLGANTTAVKAFETRDAIANGADEIDMVINIGGLKAGNEEAVRKDIEAVVEAAQGRCVKVILETCLLSDAEIVTACRLCMDAKATFVKTSTGFSNAGATVHHVKLMKDTVKEACEVKAAGGVRCKADMDAMVAAGATRIGCSAGVALMQGESSEESY